MDRRKVENFFKDQCTPEEVEEVKEWLKTPEGQAFLEERLDQDIGHLKDGDIKPMTSEIRSETMWDVIEGETQPEDKYSHDSKRTFSSYGQVAAAVILLLVSVTYYAWIQNPEPEKNVSQPITYVTGSDQQKALTLSDGTKIRLNSNAKVEIPADFNQSTREVMLEGEAFFKVGEDDEKPFVVHTDRATVKDLGTAFNVRAIPGKQNVQVAVTDGKVSIWSDQQAEETATQLTEGQFGHLDLQKETLQIERFGVNNYLSWMNGRLAYDQARLDQVSRQLSRIYNVSFSFSDDRLKKLTVSTNFERKSLKKVLEVISMTLRINYQLKGEEVVWLQQNQNADNNEYQR
ncbi:FecR family protein [Fodinibius salsisoli]|uniref:FecR domain-containing protein n=1 Tax=Fodinibius salsisoli TaxID=2820877 RepID=A0ABT3PHB6_9BACT|nr:FecR domain-containing protein [Fodinibius salsisoli]MCW9705311.1 FecR domain-containing protein [Fodinibius salsisoli]